MLSKTITILECSRVFSLPMTILSWLVVYVYCLSTDGNALYGFIAFIGLLMYAELFGDMSTGSFVGNMHILSAIIIWIAVLIMYAGLLLAKITHSISKAIQRRNDK